MEFQGLLPAIIECCVFIPDKYKTHNNPVNKFLHQLGTIGIMVSLFLVTASPAVSFSFLLGSLSSHLAGHIIEGLFS